MYFFPLLLLVIFIFYRFIFVYSGTGFLTLANSCTSVYHCGTHIPMWMHGVTPTEADGIVTRTICSPDLDGTNCCDHTSFNIQVG